MNVPSFVLWLCGPIMVSFGVFFAIGHLVNQSNPNFFESSYARLLVYGIACLPTLALLFSKRVDVKTRECLINIRHRKKDEISVSIIYLVVLAGFCFFFLSGLVEMFYYPRRSSRSIYDLIVEKAGPALLICGFGWLLLTILADTDVENVKPHR